MSALPKHKSGAAFVPDTSADNTPAPRHGERRSVKARQALPLRWPADMSERRKVLKLWRRIAMIVLREHAKVMRLTPVVPDLLIWKLGEVWATNRLLAEEAGGWSEKTIQREVELFRDLGLFAVSYGWRRDRSGEFRKTRVLRLAIPSDYSGPVPDTDDLDHGCPDGPIDDLDHGCPELLDHGCPIIVEESDGAEDADVDAV